MKKEAVRLKEPIRSMSIDLTEGCSLRCKYCFADLAAGKKAEKYKLSEDVMRAAVDWLFDDKTSGSKASLKGRPLNIELWGGEPLHNWNILTKLVEYGEKKSKETGKKIHFGGTTNVVEITEERMKYFKEHKINFLMSIDGVKEAHDKYRVFPDGSGSWDTIVEKLDMILEYMPHWQVRISLHPSNIELLYDSFEWLLSKGIYNAFYSPVYEADWTEEVWDSYERQARKIIRRQIREAKMGRRLHVKFIDDVVNYILNIQRQGINLESAENNPEQLAKLSNSNHAMQPCGAGMRYFGISVDGQIYVCHRFNKHNTHNIAPHKKYGWMGDVWKGIQNKELYEKFANWDVDKLEHCKDCPMRYSCKGGCYASNYDIQGKIDAKDENQCRFRLINYDIAKEAIDMYKEAGLFDYKQHQVKFPNMFGKNNNLPPLKVDRCFCHNGVYSIPDYMSKPEKDGISDIEKALFQAQQALGKATVKLKEERAKGNDPMKQFIIDK